MVCPRKSALVAPLLTLEDERFECVLSKAFEEGAERILAMCAAGSGSKSLTSSRGCCVTKVLDDLVRDLDKPARCGDVALRHDEPLEDSGRRAEGNQGTVSLSMAIGWSERHEIEQGEDAPFCLKSPGPRRRGGWGVGQESRWR